MLKWKIETLDLQNKKVTFVVDHQVDFSFEEKERNVPIQEVAEMNGMVHMMQDSKYIHMECTKLD